MTLTEAAAVAESGVTLPLNFSPFPFFLFLISVLLIDPRNERSHSNTCSPESGGPLGAASVVHLCQAALVIFCLKHLRHTNDGEERGKGSESAVSGVLPGGQH